MVLLGVVDSLPGGDLGQSLAGAPQLPCYLARTHLRRVVEEEEEEGGKGKREVKRNTKRRGKGGGM